MNYMIVKIWKQCNCEAEEKLTQRPFTNGYYRNEAGGQRRLMMNKRWEELKLNLQHALKTHQAY